MMTIGQILYPLLVGVMIPLGASAQKIETERRVAWEDFPSAGHQFLLDSFPSDTKWKLYVEHSNAGQTFEAKGTVDGYPHSIEFYADGRFMDVEKTISIDETPSGVLRALELALQADFKKHRIMKIQAQSSSAGDRFEIELKAKSHRKWQNYQYLLSAEGDVLNIEEILATPIDFIFY